MSTDAVRPSVRSAFAHRLSLLVTVLLVASPAATQNLVYQSAGAFPSDLLEVDVDTLTGTKLMSFTLADQVHAITVCNSGSGDDPILAIGRNAAEVIEVDLVTLGETLLGFLPPAFTDSAVVQLDCDEDGVLYLTDQNREELHRLDPADCNGIDCPPTLVGRVETAPGAADIDVDGADVKFGPDGQLYLLTNANGLDRALFVVDTTTALATRIGSVATTENNNGLASVPDGRFIVSCNDDNLYEMDPATAAVVPLGTLTIDGEPFDIASGDLASPPVFDEPEATAICRTGGYWATHGGDFDGRPNITQAVIDAAGGTLEVCGQTVDRSIPVGDLGSALEGLCVKVQGVGQRQLYRQLTATALNCVLSGAADCDSLVADYSQCDALCATGVGDLTTSDCVFRLNCFNNGGTFDPLTDSCEFTDDDCHERPLCDSPDPSLCFDPEGPASSPRECHEARKNGCTIDGC